MQPSDGAGAGGVTQAQARGPGHRVRIASDVVAPQGDLHLFLAEPCPSVTPLNHEGPRALYGGGGRREGGWVLSLRGAPRC